MGKHKHKKKNKNKNKKDKKSKELNPEEIPVIKEIIV